MRFWSQDVSDLGVKNGRSEILGVAFEITVLKNTHIWEIGSGPVLAEFLGFRIFRP